MYIRVLADEWVRLLKLKHSNKRKKHVLKSRVYLHVFVLADKAANNVIVVCNKYYLGKLMEELQPIHTQRCRAIAWMWCLIYI